MIFESHAHYEDEKFDEDRRELLNSLPAAGVEYVVNIGSGMDSSRRTMELLREYPFMYGAVGVHPDECGQMTDEDLEELETMSEDSKVVAIGETGLDYYWDAVSRDLQKHWFVGHMELARRSGLPLVIHSRDAARDTLDVMKGNGAKDLNGVIHCFAYSKEVARDFLDMGYYIGVGGVVTFPNAKNLKEVVKYAPLDRILLETDSPYLAPVPNRGKRNSSHNLTYIARAIAELRGVAYDEVIETTRNNAMQLLLEPVNIRIRKNAQ